MTENVIPPKLAEIIEDFSYCEGNEKLEYLLELSESMPTFPPEIEALKDDIEEVHECISPVFVYGESNDGVMTFYFNAPPEAPTARGFASMLMQGVNGSSAEQVLAIPNDFYLATGLNKVLSGQRMRGLGAFLNYMKRFAADTLTSSATSEQPSDVD